MKAAYLHFETVEKFPQSVFGNLVSGFANSQSMFGKPFYILYDFDVVEHFTG